MFLNRPKTTSPHLHALIFTRFMGGGPRTFPGGLNKWQWKRLHEKKATEKQNKLLEQEKQIYQSRVRSQIRSKLAGKPDPIVPENEPVHGPMSPKQHLSALADRFMKEGFEDLWNDDDGPVVESKSLNSRPVRREGSMQSNIGVRRLVEGSGRGLERNGMGKDMRFNEMQSHFSGKNVVFDGLDEMGSAEFESQLSNLRSFGRPGLIQSPVHANGCGLEHNSMNKRFMHYSIRSCFSGQNLSFVGKGVMGSDEFAKPISMLSNSRCFGSIQSPIDVRKLIMEDTHSVEHNGMENVRLVHCSVQSNILCRQSVFDGNGVLGSGEILKPRFYSASLGRRYRRNESSSSDSDSEYSLPNKSLVRDFVSNSRWERLGLKDGESSTDVALRRKGDLKKKMNMASSAALGKYDMKITKRIPLENFDEGDNLSEQVEFIRHELRKKNLMEKEVEQDNEESLLSDKRFDECNISPLTVKALSAAGYVQMTRVQEASLSVALQGQDALVKARTGTGKSAAFLLPAIEAVLKATSSSTSAQRVPPICVLILSPTRELASQIAAEANVMVKHHDGIGVQTLVGGTRFKVDQKRLESEPCQIIVATPGRLLDHIENKSGFSVRLMGMKMLIVDEADHLLDLGFRKDMEKIVDCLPRSRQSLLFSATLPKEVRRISQLVLKREHASIDTVGLGNVDTPAKIRQSYLIAQHEQHFHIVHHILKEHVSQVPEYKVIVFCSTAMVTSLVFLLLRDMKLNVREIHSRKPQMYRTRISDEFKESKRLILVTSDVSARGLDYPDVTLVLQVGLPSDREQYIHRLGRTGREGKEGEGILLLAPWEEYFMDEIHNLPVRKSRTPQLDPDMKIKLEDSMAKIDHSVKEAAYHAWLGYYNSVREIGRDKSTLVELAKQFGESIGLQNPPTMFRKTALKMGLKDIPGIRIRK